MESTLSRTPKMRRTSFWYRSIALGIFSECWRRNQRAWPKYGLVRDKVRLTVCCCAARVDRPLTGRLEHEPLQLRGLVLEGLHGQLALGVILVGEVRDDRVRLPVVAVRSVLPHC